jgi:hypothetical protein
MVSVWQKALLGTKFVEHPAGTVSVTPGSGTTVTLKTPAGISSVNGPVYVTTTSGLTSNVVNPGL